MKKNNFNMKKTEKTFEENKNNRKTFNFSYVLIGLITIGLIFILFRKNLQIIKKLLKK